MRGTFFFEPRKRFLNVLTISPLNHEVRSRNKENYQQPKKLLIVTQILLVRTLENVWGIVWRTALPMLGCKGLTPIKENFFHNAEPFCLVIASFILIPVLYESWVLL